MEERKRGTRGVALDVRRRMLFLLLLLSLQVEGGKERLAERHQTPRKQKRHPGTVRRYTELKRRKGRVTAPHTFPLLDRIDEARDSDTKEGHGDEEEFFSRKKGREANLLRST